MDQKNSELQVVSIEELQKRRHEKQILNRWTEFYHSQAHEDLLEALVHEHENNFPLRNSAEALDRLRHRALIQTLQERAQSEFLKSLLLEINQTN